jgi:hypothetical protein
LEINEFIALLKKTPMRVRQHDAINMFHELAVRHVRHKHMAISFDIFILPQLSVRMN